MVGAVPIGTCLIGYGREDIIDQLLIEGGCHTDWLGKNGVAVLTHTVASLTPPIVRRNIETVNRNGLVHHQAHLLLGGEQRNEILHTGFIGQTGIPERILLFPTLCHYLCFG